MSDTNAELPTPSGRAHVSANWRDACATARKERLNQGLRTLASWAQSRAMGEHDDEATLTMLERKTAELRAAVNKAGWDSVAESYMPNAGGMARELAAQDSETITDLNG